jgi:hypothetical protein
MSKHGTATFLCVVWRLTNADIKVRVGHTQRLEGVLDPADSLPAAQHGLGWP